MAIPDTSVVKSLLDSSTKISLLLPVKPKFDAVAAALGLKLSLDLVGKSTRVVCPDPMLVEFNRLVGVETIINKFGSRNLIIAFPNQTEHVDNVSYNIENGVLQLVISPKSEAPELDHHRLRFITAAGKQDLLVTIGVTDLHELGPVYDEVKDLFQAQSSTVVSLSHTPHRDQFALYQLHDYDSISLSQIAAHTIDSLGLPLDSDSASNLLAGLEKATDSFRSAKVTVATFEIAAKLMRHGAKRATELSASDFPTGAIPTAPNVASGEVGQPLELAPDQIPTEQQLTSTPSASPSPKTNGKKSAPPDWYEPKIYKGPMLP
jgi:hypothetical protein